jgi:hypothetical protein
LIGIPGLKGKQSDILKTACGLTYWTLACLGVVRRVESGAYILENTPLPP